jgi:hypothetical protein
MQTFIPEGADLNLGFRRLDYRRLGKQRVEAWQILNVLRGVDNDGNPRTGNGWSNHPAVLMWKGHETGLALYGVLCCEEWIRRGYQDSLLERFRSQTPELKLPDWLWDSDVVTTHRSNLIRKFSEHYQPFWPDVPDDLEYIWPSQ